MSIEVGDIVETYGWLEGLTGIVTKVIKGYTARDHGTIEIQISKVSPGFPHIDGLKAGDIEHFSYYKWDADLRRIS